MARLALSLLGPFQLELDGKPVTDFESDRVRALLAYLAVEADLPHRRVRLAGLLWPDWPDRSALTNLRNALSNLRKTIGDRETATPVLSVDRETIQLNSAADIWIDAAAFKTLTAADQTISSLEKAVALYRGAFLEGFALKDSAAFEEWAQVVRDQMQRACLTALEQLADDSERRGNLEKACEYCWKQIDLAPWHEQAHRHLMRLLALSGQRTAALAQYETCRHALQQELNVEPAAETVELYESIRDGKLEQTRETSTPPASSPKPPSLPVWLTPFVGRQELLAEIFNHLQDPACRLLTLVGPGGSGKTRLAVEAVTRMPVVFPNGVCFVSLASLQSPENIVPAIAQALRFVFREQEEPRPQLLHYIRKKEILLVLDNFEHLINDPESERGGGVEIVTELLQAAPTIKILITSRVALNAQGEYLLPIPGMKYPEQAPANLSDALEYGAVQLFIQDAQRVRPDFEPTNDDLVQVLQICRLVQGMPLGLLLAAAWMRMLSPAEIATQLAAQKLDFLEAEWHDVPERQRSMRAVFDYSWRLLTERERQVLMGLSVFRGGFTYAAAQQVATVQGAPAALRDLMGLVNSSMLQRTPTGRFEMHELLRQYVDDKLRKMPDEDRAVRNRHTVFFMAALRQWAIEMQGPCQQDALADLDVEINNVRAGWSWAVRQDQIDRLADGIEGLGPFCDWRARYREGEKSFRIVADKLATHGLSQPTEHLKVWASTLAWQARFNQRMGAIDRARERARQSLALLDEPALAGQDVRRERALALGVIGEIQVQFGNAQEGKEPLTASLAYYRELDERRSIAFSLRSLGRMYERMGNYSQAVELHRESVDICRVLGAQRDTVDALLDLVVDLSCLGQAEEAERRIQESLTLAQQLGDPATITAVRYRMAMNSMDMDPVASLAMLEECVVTFAELGDRHRWALALMRVGNVHMHLGQYTQAHTSLQESLTWYRQVDNWWGIGAALNLEAELLLIEDKPAEAWQLLQESATAFRRNGARSDVSWALANLGMTAVVLGNLDQARQHLADAMHIALKFRHQMVPAYALMGQAVLAAKEGQAERALEFWILATQAVQPNSSRVYKDLYKRYLAPAIETLPPAMVAAARERGRARDVWETLEELLAELRK